MSVGTNSGERDRMTERPLRLLPSPLSTFKIKHQLLIWRLKRQAAKVAARAHAEKATKGMVRTRIHDAGF
jgi:hypothetical protein